VTLRRDSDEFAFDSLDYRVRYQPSGEEFRAEPGTLDHFLTERYAMAIDSPQLYLCNFEYEPWRLRPAEAEIAVDRLAGGGTRPELFRFSAEQHVRFSAPKLA
jgi:uncharacterized protein YqjF (DUF2071 family)